MDGRGWEGEVRVRRVEEREGGIIPWGIGGVFEVL